MVIMPVQFLFRIATTGSLIMLLHRIMTATVTASRFAMISILIIANHWITVALVFILAVVPSARFLEIAHPPVMIWGYFSAGESAMVLLKIVCCQIILDME